MLLVMEHVDGRSLDLVPQHQIGDDLLDRLWTVVRTLHGARLAHRSLRAANVMVDRSGRPWLVDFGFGELAAYQRQIDLDVAELLASTGTLVGPDRAVSAAMRVLGAGSVAAAVPLLQPMALSAGTRRAAAGQRGLLARTRSAAAARPGGPDEQLASVQRVRPRTLLAITAAGGPRRVRAHLRGQRAVADRQRARPAAVLAHADDPGRLAFVNRISPANVAGMALNARFLQKSGVEARGRGRGGRGQRLRRRGGPPGADGDLLRPSRPPPGGVGAFETALVAGLTGIGVRSGAAVPAVITYRLATYWPPVVPGWAAFQLLQRRNLI